jgi:hypothetical protein
MKNLIFVFALLAAGPALAEDAQGWLCNLRYQAQAQGFQIVVGQFEMKGKGTLNCVSATTDAKKSIPVIIRAKARPLSPKIAIGKYMLYGTSANIALLTHEPEDLLGTYYVAQAQGSVIGGLGVIVGTHVNHSDMTLHLSVNAVKGFGFNVGGSRFILELDESRM